MTRCRYGFKITVRVVPVAECLIHPALFLNRLSLSLMTNERCTKMFSNNIAARRCFIAVIQKLTFNAALTGNKKFFVLDF